MGTRRLSDGALAIAVAVVMATAAPEQPKTRLPSATPSREHRHPPRVLSGYWWDHTDLTVAVLSAPNVDPVLAAAIRDTIATWSEVLATQFPTVSLTDVTDTARNPHLADITVHYVPHAGGIVWGGIALCGDHKCNNVIVRSDVPDLIDVGVPNYDPVRVYRVALHELGHVSASVTPNRSRRRST